jgi:hypothetical protein
VTTLFRGRTSAIVSIHTGRAWSFPGKSLMQDEAARLTDLLRIMPFEYHASLHLSRPSIEPGKLSDIAVLSQGIFAIAPDKLPNTNSVRTFVGDKLIFDSHVRRAN